ncbi:molybdopterin dinucleotide binding domain-containing protein, partial [Streptomyces sp. NPDC127079]|uniref:molybdopterin dinucleotide binding domain-containing protein n=1 Tax=Streptomyces sp. NPDC127079 TaxID=3347132 RepID=UPI003652B3EE
RLFEAAVKPDLLTRRLAPPDGGVLLMRADAMDVHLGLPDLRSTRAELDRLGGWDGPKASAPRETGAPLPRPAAGEAVLAGHRLLLDQGVLQDGDEALAGTRHAAHARLSAATAAEAGVADGALLAVTGTSGTVELPLRITEMPDRVVWLPLNSVGGGVASDTGTQPGSLVRIGPAATAGEAPKEVEA